LTSAGDELTFVVAAKSFPGEIAITSFHSTGRGAVHVEEKMLSGGLRRCAIDGLNVFRSGDFLQ
jgi:hypothetical protein